MPLEPFSFHPKQKIFHEIQDYGPDGVPLFTSVLFGGSAGPGKSFAIGGSAVLRAAEEPGSVIFILRLHLNDLKRSTLQVFEQFVCPEGCPLWKLLGISFNRSDMIMTLRNTADPTRGIPPSEIHWLGLRAAGGRIEESYSKLLSTQWSHGYGDESFELPEETVAIFPNRIRLVRNIGGQQLHYRRGIRYASNPAPNWLKENFITNPRPRHHFIPCTWEENAANLPPDYDSSFDLMTEGMRQRFKHGNWDAYEGQVWNPIHAGQILPRLALAHLDPMNWAVYRACDPGLNDPTALATAIYHHDTDTLIFVNEYEENEREVPYHAAKFKQQFHAMFPDRRPSTDLIDPAAAQRTLATGLEVNVIALFRSEEFYFRPANNSTDVKTLTMASRMCYNPARVNPLTGSAGGWGVYFVGPDTERMRKAIQHTTWAPPTPTGQQRWVNKNKHLVDCATYITAQLGSQARAKTARGETSALDAALQPPSEHKPDEPRRWRGRGAAEPGGSRGIAEYFDE